MSRTLLVVTAAAALSLVGCGQNADTASGNSQVAPGAAQEASSAPEPARPAARSLLSVPSGTLLEVKLNEGLNSGTTTVGENFTAEVTEDVMVNGQTAIPAGSIVHGTVAKVVPAKRGAGNAQLTLAFSQLELSGGYSTGLTATLSQSTGSKKKRNAAVIGGSAAGGALLGRLIGKDTKGAVVGAIVGGGIGTGVVMSKEGAQVNIPGGTELTIQLEEPVKVPHR